MSGVVVHDTKALDRIRPFTREELGTEMAAFMSYVAEVYYDEGCVPFDAVDDPKYFLQLCIETYLDYEASA